jgi:hypothetical protein
MCLAASGGGVEEGGASWSARAVEGGCRCACGEGVKC